MNKYDMASIILLSIIIVMMIWLVINNGTNSYSNGANGIECIYNCDDFKTLVQGMK